MSEIKIKPLEDRVVVLSKPTEEVTAGGLIIPGVAKEIPVEGTVMAVGDGNNDVTMLLNVGDVIIYRQLVGTEITSEGTTYLVMKQSDVLAVIN